MSKHDALDTLNNICDALRGACIPPHSERGQAISCALIQAEAIRSVGTAIEKLADAIERSGL